VNDLPGPKSAHLALSGSRADSLPVMTVIISTVDVPNSYSPGAMTPTVAGDLAVLKAMDFTLPPKYSFVLNICVSLATEFFSHRAHRGHREIYIATKMHKKLMKIICV
jgi:hypothetical protein